jgi:hypothetical protein
MEYGYCDVPARTKVIFVFSFGMNNLYREPAETNST